MANTTTTTPSARRGEPDPPVVPPSAPTAARPRRSVVADLALLTGPDALHLLDAALAPGGGRVLAWRPGEVTPRGGGATVRYRAEVVWADGRRSDEILVAATGDLPRGALVLEDGDDRVAVWRFPHDPRLPALAAATDPDAVAALLADLGLGSGPVELRTRAYRPGRRAVIEAVGARGRLFLKVVRPSRVEELHGRHRLLVERGVPAPQSLGWTPGGLVVLQALPDPTLRQLIGRPGVRLPGADAVTDLLDRLPVEWAAGTPGRSWLDRVGHYAAVTSAVVPDQAGRLARIVDAIEDEAGTGPTVAVHGDLYDSQLLVSGGAITGLLDIDTIRPGDRIDDLACMLGHLSVLAAHDQARADAVNRLGADLLRGFERTVDAADLRYRVAAVVISLTTGPHRVQQANWEGATRALVGLAERWLDSARELTARSRR